MAKILFTANVHQHFLDCHIPYIKWLSEQNHEVHVAAAGDEPVPYASKQFQISIHRSPFRLRNIKAFFELKKIISLNHYNIVHCHTPTGAALTRLAAWNFRRKGLLKVLYTAHGFHFYKGAPLSYWLCYYPVEKILSRMTDVIITINNEDYELVKTKGFRNGRTFKINGMGVSPKRFRKLDDSERIELRKKYGYSEDDFLVIYAAEFIRRKNHRFVIDALPLITKDIPGIKVLFAGKGELFEKTKKYAVKKGVSGNIDFLGWRDDIEKLMVISDIGISSSRQEGLGMNIAEEMFCGLPCVATEDRGHREMIIHGINGYLFPQNDHGKFAELIKELFNDPEKRRLMGENALKTIQRFDIKNSLDSMKEIYGMYIG